MSKVSDRILNENKNISDGDIEFMKYCLDRLKGLRFPQSEKEAEERVLDSGNFLCQLHGVFRHNLIWVDNNRNYHYNNLLCSGMECLVTMKTLVNLYREGVNDSLIQERWDSAKFMLEHVLSELVK